MLAFYRKKEGFKYRGLLRKVLQNRFPWQRICDLCGNEYEMNNKEIPRIIVKKKIDISDLVSKDVYANPDYCDLCIRIILRLLQKKTSLSFRTNYTDKILVS